jgi:ZIP family zinc transporter/zinc and cadmium transporter
VTQAELLYALSAAGANIVGALAVTSRARWSVKALDTFISVAAGFLISVSLVELFPESLARVGARGAVVVLFSYLLVHFTQHTIGRHFHFGEETHEVSQLVSMSALIGLLMHTFVDGVAVASGFQVSRSLGFLVFVAVLLHKFPEGFAISSLFLAAGAPRSRALLAAVALGLTTLLGVVLTDTVPLLREYGLPVSTGVTLYVGASNLVPEFQAKRGWRVPLSFALGCALFFLARAVGRG